MNRLSGKRVLITGASSGIGEACARAFAASGAHLLLAARRRERLDDLAEALVVTHSVEVRTDGLDVTDRVAVERYVEGIAREALVPDILLNNAGKAVGLDRLYEGSIDDWEDMIDTNLKGLLYMTRAVLPHMVKRDSGHVINIGSTAGRWTYPRGAVYCATKFAVRSLTEGMGMDLLGTSVRVSSVDPGMTRTEFSDVRFHGDTERASKVYEGVTPLKGSDIADAVVYIANTPAHVNVLNMVLMPTAQRHPLVLHREKA